MTALKPAMPGFVAFIIAIIVFSFAGIGIAASFNIGDMKLGSRARYLIEVCEMPDGKDCVLIAVPKNEHSTRWRN